MSGILSEIRQALRSLAGNRGFALACVAVFALGIGASTAIYTVVERILFRPLPGADSERVVTICETHEGKGDYCSVSPPDAGDWAAQSRTLESVGVGRSEAVSLGGADGRATLVTGGIATPDLFRALGIRPLLGRLITASDLPPRGSAHVVVLTYGLWRERFGGDPGVLGRDVTLDDAPYTVVGVLPEDAYVPRLDYARLWRPLPFDPRDEANRGWRGFVGVGRLRPEVAPERAEEDLLAINEAGVRAHPEEMRGWGVEVQRMRDYLVGGARPMLLLFLAAAGVMLLIVCVNVAGLLLVRATSRVRETSIRLALGATRGAIMRWLLTESVMLALLGGAVGVLLASWATAAFVRLAPSGVPRLGEVALDGRALAFALAMSLTAGALAGLAPALRLRRTDLSGAMRDGRTATLGRRTGRARQALVAGQLALALVLVVTAALLLRSFAGLMAWDPGFDPDRVLTFHLFPSPGRYPESAQVLALYRDAEAEIRAIAGVEATGTMSAGPIFGGDGNTAVLVEGRGDSRTSAPTAAWFDVGPTYFATLGIPLVRGRGFTEADDARGAPVAVINEAMARRLWGDGDPLGATLELPELGGRRVRVVGVVRDMAPFHPGEPSAPQLYFPNRQYTRWATYFAVRTTGDPHRLIDPITTAVQRLDPSLEMARPQTIGEVAVRLRGAPRFQLLLVALFAALALLLGVLGVYGVMAYTVRARTHEIGIRTALGGRPAQIVAGVLASGLRLLAVGLAFGLAGSLAASRLLTALLYGVRPTDPLALAAAAITFLLAGSAAALLPALRAGRTDAMDALRRE